MEAFQRYWPFVWTGEFPTQRPVTRSFDIYFDLRRMNAWLKNHRAGDLGRHRALYDVIVMTGPRYDDNRLYTFRI